MEIRLKRFLSLAMAILMVISLMPANIVFATEVEGSGLNDSNQPPHTCDFAAVLRTTEPTCTEDGEKILSCECGETSTVVIPAPGHTFVDGVCGTCGAADPDYVAPTCEHSYDAVVTAPDCENGGYTTYTCSKCNDTYTADEEDALGHSYTNGVCGTCGAADPDYVPPTTAPACEHKWNEEARNGLCLTCGAICEHKGETHVETIPATCKEVGYELVVCDICTASIEGKELPKADHVYVDGKCECGAENVASYAPAPASETAPAEITDAEKENLELALISCSIGSLSIWGHHHDVTWSGMTTNNGVYTYTVTVSLVEVKAEALSAFDDGHAGHTHSIPEGMPDSVEIPVTWNAEEEKWVSTRVDYIYTCTPEKPVANVSVQNAIVLEPESYMVWPSGYDTVYRPLQIVMNFKSTDTLEQATASGYGKYKCDFYLTVSGLTGGSLTADDCYLAGNYGSFGWIVIPADGMEIVDGVTYPVVSGYDANITYEQVCGSVKDFTAAIYIAPALLDAHPNMKVTLELRMTNPNDAEDVLVIGEPAEYTVANLRAGTPKKPAVAFEGTIENATQAGIVSEVQYNSAVNNYDPTNVPAGATLEIVLDSATVVENVPTELVFDVTPKQGGVEVEPAGEITFRLPVPYEWAGYVKVYHDGDSMGIYGIKGSGNAKYVEISSSEFSKFAVKEADVVAESNGQGFDTLQAAIDAGGNITLLADVELTESLVIPADKTITLELNGKTITNTTETDGFEAVAIKNSGNLTINGEGTVSGSYGALYNDLKATMTIYGGTYEVRYGFGLVNDGNATINGGTFEGIGAYNPGSITINGGTINVGRDPDDAASPEYALYFRADFVGRDENISVTINGGTINGNVYAHDGGVGEFTTFDITNGTFKGKFVAPGNDEPNPPAISGGTFAVNPAETYLADGYETVENTDGTYTVALKKVDVRKPENTDSLVKDETTGNAVSGEAVTTIVTQITTSDSVKNVTNVPEGATLIIVPISISVESEGETIVVTKLTYDVEPRDAQGNEVQPTENIVFNLPIPRDLPDYITHAAVYHENTHMGDYEINGTGVNRYVTIESKDFSKFTIELIDVAASDIAQVGSKGYKSLSEAVAVGGEVKLLKDVELTESVTVPAGKTVVLDLNGKTVSYTSNATNWDALIANKGNLTIKDSGENGKLIFTPTNTSTSYSSDTIENTGTLTILGGTIQNTVGAGASYAIHNNSSGSNATLTVEGGTIIGTSTAIRQYANSASRENNITISGGTVTGEFPLRVHVFAAGGKGKLEISGGTLTSTDTTYNYVLDIQGYNECSGKNTTVAIKGGTLNGNIGVSNVTEMANGVTISGGTITGSWAIYDYAGVGAFAVTGGTFKSTALGYVNSYIVDGYEAVGNSDDTFTVQELPDVAKIGEQGYKSLKKAINAVQNGETITLLQDCAENVTVEQKNGVSLTIDGGNKTFSGKITIKARSNKDATETLTIQNFNFKTTENNHYFIQSVETNHYPVNVTIKNCNFEGTGSGSSVVPMEFKSANNLVIDGCTATKVHSLLQNTSGWNITIKNSKVTDSGRGISLGSAQNVLIESVEIEALDTKYGIRANAEISNSTVTIADSKITALIPVVLRQSNGGSADNYKLNINGENSFTAKNNEGVLIAIGVEEYGDVTAENLTQAKGRVVVTVNDTGLNTELVGEAYKTIICGTEQRVGENVYLTKAAEAVIGETYYTTLAEAAAASQTGTIKLLVDITLTSVVAIPEGKMLDLNGNTITGDVVGKISINGGTYVTPERAESPRYEMMGSTRNSKYYTTDAVVTIEGATANIILHSGAMKLQENWWTLPGQTLTIEEPASFTIPENVTLNVRSEVIVNGTVDVKGTVDLYTADATVKAPAGLNVVTTLADGAVAYENGIYKVASVAATIGEKKYASVTDAAAAAEPDDTIVLRKDATLTEALVIPEITLDLNGKTIKGDVLGTIAINEGTYYTSQNYKMMGPDADYYKTTDAVLTMVDINGSITLHSGSMEQVPELWWTLDQQTLTVGPEATFKIPAGKTLNVRSTVVVEGSAVVDGTVNLYETTATVKAPAGLNVVTTLDNYVVVYENGSYVVKENLDAAIDMSNVADGKINAGDKVYVNGTEFAVNGDLEIVIPKDDALAKRTAMFVTTYEYDSGTAGKYPIAMYVWFVKGVDNDGDGICDTYTAERVSELDNFFKYHGTSIRVGSAKNGIRFFSSVDADDAADLMSGKLITSGSLEGATMTSAGTWFKKVGGTKEARSEVYGGSVGSTFRTFQKAEGRNWFTGVLTGLDTTPETIVSDIQSRPYAELKVGNEMVTLYGGILERSIYDVAKQNQDYFTEGSAHDQFVENLITKGEDFLGEIRED